MGVRTELLINGTWTTPAISAVSSTRPRAPRAKLMRRRNWRRLTPTRSNSETHRFSQGRCGLQCFVAENYHRRVECFSDDVMAVALTLLVLELKLPSGLGNELKFGQRCCISRHLSPHGS